MTTAGSKTNTKTNTTAGGAGPATAFADLRERIRGAYLEATGGAFNQRALLRDVRARLADIGRQPFDDALRRMQREGNTSLMQLDNRVDITDADRAAALIIGREPRHILWISQ